MILILDFQGQILEGYVPGMEKPIDLEWKGYESIGCRTPFVTSSYVNCWNDW